MASNSISPFRADALNGKVALVTGGGSGIGLEISRQFGRHGCKIAFTGRRGHVLKAAEDALREEGIECMGIQGDVRSADDCNMWVAEVVKHWGQLNILVGDPFNQIGPRVEMCDFMDTFEASLPTWNGAFVEARGRLYRTHDSTGNFLVTAEELSVNGFRTVMEIDAVGTFNMSRAAFGALREAGQARIINISATLHYGATWYQVHASAAKAAVDSITRSLALEWSGYGITVNAVAPGPIKDTAGMTKLAPGMVDMEAILAETIPVGRMGDKLDIGLACVYLASDAASFISGHSLVVDGAAWMWRPNGIPRELVSKSSRGAESSSRQVGIGNREMRSKL